MLYFYSYFYFLFWITLKAIGLYSYQTILLLLPLYNILLFHFPSFFFHFNPVFCFFISFFNCSCVHYFISSIFFASTTTWPSPPDFSNTPSGRIEDFSFSSIGLLGNEEDNEICKQARNREETLSLQRNRVLSYSNAREQQNKRLFENSRPIPKASFTKMSEKRKID